MNVPESSKPSRPQPPALSGAVLGQGDKGVIESVGRPPQEVFAADGNSRASVDESVAGRVIELEDLVKDYGPVVRRVRALDGITMRVGHGITGLLGPNGAGKTTLIKVLLGLVRISSGTGTVLGFDLTRQARSIRQNVGFMPEDDCYIPGLSGVEMVQFAARLSGLPRTEALRRAHEILDFCGVEQERYRAVDTYSTGVRQKIKFAQAIVHDPPLLILDEPTAGLDPDERTGMLHRVELLARGAGKAVLISTHILPDVRAICKMVVILADGRVRVTDSLDALSQPASPAIHVRPASDPARLIERITGAGGTVAVQDDGVLRVVVDQDDTAEMVWHWARETNVGIRSLTRSRNSMEQIFMDAVRGDRRADP
ncbi:MAG: ABC transporter ATP-binding protein [Planctomycetota bacterium]